MRTIGILGGTSWPSTMAPYNMINAEVARRLGGHHSARIILYSIDYDPIKSLYHHGWDRIPALLKREIEFLARMKPDCLMIANNTLHKAFDLIETEMALPFPVFHAVRLTSQALTKAAPGKTLFLGTSFTMDDDFFKGALARDGVDIIIPDAAERIAIQKEQTALAQGESPVAARVFFSELLRRYENQGCEAVVLACTELPLAIDPSLTQMTLIDPLALQCATAIDFALKERDVEWAACA
ncbi:MAG: amino acid racemase [Pseudomonadota bacterium]|nr:amino acid racemase [Pseudomonadota bacterium]